MMKGSVGKCGTKVWNPRSCRHKRMPNHHSYFEQWNTINQKSLNLERLQELKNTTASHRSNTPVGCLADCFHGPQSLVRRVSWPFISTKFLRERNCCLAQGQLLPGLTTHISWTVFTPHSGIANFQWVPYTVHFLWLKRSTKWSAFPTSCFILVLKAMAAKDYNGENSTSCEDTGRESLLFPSRK